MPVSNEREAALFEQPSRAQGTNASHDCGLEVQRFFQYYAASGAAVFDGTEWSRAVILNARAVPQRA